jgi:hypothetical protein
MNCKDARAAFLAGDDDTKVTTHLVECGACRSVRADLVSERSALRDAAVWEEPPDTLGPQVISLITSSARPTVAVQRRRWVVPMAAAAAITVIALGIGLLFQNDPPDWEIAMPGTSLAPEASSTVAGWNTPVGTRMVLDVRGLDPAPEGYVYELWLSRGAIHVSAGTFTDSGVVELGTGVARAEFPRLWVTLEPLDEDESPSGRTVLDTAG